MKIRDMVRISQSNLMRSKLRTALTILAVFIGTFSISMTNGVGNGVKSYVNKQLGNVGVENSFFVQAKQTQQNPLATEVVKYDPNKRTGAYNVALITAADVENIRNIKNVQKVTPNFTPQIDYVTGQGDKYEASAQQYIEGFNLDLAAGLVVNLSQDDEVTIPIRYVAPLGFASAQDAVGKRLTLGYKNSQGQIVEKSLTIVGVQQESILGSSALYINPDLASQIQKDQLSKVTPLADAYQAVIVQFDKNLPQVSRDELKQLLQANNYTAQTIQDQIGSFSKVINGILVGLNVFGIVALLVAAFGIVNTLFMSVNERTSEIGLMKALGANSRTIFSIFSLEAASIGFWGGILGILVSTGAGTILNKYAANHFLKDFAGFNLLSFPVAPTIYTLVGIVVLAFLAGALPSIKASRLDPIKALRYE